MTESDLPEPRTVVEPPDVPGFSPIRLLSSDKDVDVFLCRQISPLREVVIEVMKRRHDGSSTGLPTSGRRRSKRSASPGFQTGVTPSGSSYLVRLLTEAEAIARRRTVPESTRPITQAPTGPRQIVNLIESVPKSVVPTHDAPQSVANDGSDSGASHADIEVTQRRVRFDEATRALPVTDEPDKSVEVPEGVEPTSEDDSGGPLEGDENRHLVYTDGGDEGGDDEVTTDGQGGRHRALVGALVVLVVALLGGGVWTMVSHVQASNRRKAQAAAHQRWVGQTVLTVDGTSYTRGQISGASAGYYKATHYGEDPTSSTGAERNLVLRLVDNARDHRVLSAAKGTVTAADEAENSLELTGVLNQPKHANPSQLFLSRVLRTQYDLASAITRTLKGDSDGAARALYEQRKDAEFSDWCLNADAVGDPDPEPLSRMLWMIQRGSTFDDASIFVWGDMGSRSDPGRTDEGCATKASFIHRKLPPNVTGALQSSPVGTVVGPIAVPNNGYFSWDPSGNVDMTGMGEALFQLRQKYRPYVKVQLQLKNEVVKSQSTLLRTNAVKAVKVKVDSTFGQWHATGSAGSLTKS